MFASVLDDVERGLAKLLAGEELLDVARCSRLRNQVERLWLQAVDEHAQAGEWAEAGYVNAAASVRDACGLTQISAQRDVTLGRKLRELSLFSAAMAKGELSRAHVAQFADACTPDRAEALRQVEREFVAAARVTNTRQFRQVVERYASALDGDDGAGDANRRHERRRVHVSELLDGMWKLDGLLEPEQGRKLRSWLQRRVWEATKAGDPRSAAQVRADALMELVECGEAHAQEGPGRNAVADLAIHLTLPELEARGCPEVASLIREESPHGLTKATLRRLACDARIARIITDGRSEVLDVGRASREPTAAQWRALVARDGGCRARGCDRGPGWCHAHHIHHWIDDGPTDLANLILLCSYHYRTVHEGKRELAGLLDRGS